MSSPFRIAKIVALPLLALLLLRAPAVSAEQIKNLKTQGYVNDFAGVLSAQAKDKLTALCAEVDQKAQAQIAIATVSSLEGEPIEQFSIDLATAWGIGPKQKDRGVLILLAPNDRKYRIEVGYGLEAILPDGKVGGFGREAVPFLRQNDYSGAVLLMTERVASVIAEDRKVALETDTGIPAPAQEQEEDKGPSLFSGLIFAAFLVFFILFPVLGFVLRVFFGIGAGPRSWRGGGGWMGGAGYGGGSWGGGGGFSGGGGGGFGGFGGGGFGGGGASGGW